MTIESVEKRLIISSKRPVSPRFFRFFNAAGFQGLSTSEANEVMLIHELLLTGSAGDDKGQQITLANGDTVTGSAGITAEVRQQCIHH